MGSHVSATALALNGAAAADTTVTNLRCGYLTNPSGLDLAHLWLSSILESNRRGEVQTTYQFLVATSLKNLKANRGDLWDSSKVDSDQSAHGIYAGRPLRSEMQGAESR